jgi:hypothetical protein
MIADWQLKTIQSGDKSPHSRGLPIADWRLTIEDNPKRRQAAALQRLDRASSQRRQIPQLAIGNRQLLRRAELF